MSNTLSRKTQLIGIMSRISSFLSSSIILALVLYTIAGKLSRDSSEILPQTISVSIIITNCLETHIIQCSAAARSVSENTLQGGQSHNQLVSNRQSSNKLMQSAASYTSGNQNRCQQGWIWFNNKCWVATLSRRDFAHAVELCKRTYNSTLPTIHSEDENEFLRQNIDLQSGPIWLYARHNHQYNKTRWLDKSPVNYTRWDVGQPSDKSSLVCIKTDDTWYMRKAEPVDGQTECVSFWEDAKWGTQVGCLVLLPVVCEKKLTPISRLVEGPNGSLTSQSELQMAPVSGAQSVFTIQFLTMQNIFAIVTAILLYQHQSAKRQTI